jgi:hypothetical protein
MIDTKFKLYFDGWEPEFYTLAEMIDNREANGYKYISQYIGLQDKKGIDIYEGDILLGMGIVCKVIYDEEYSHFTFLILSNGFKVEISKNKIDVVGLIIIGNIYENPELLND